MQADGNVTPQVRAGLAMVQSELYLRGAHSLHNLIYRLIAEGDLDRASMLLLAVMMKVRKERESAAFLVALGGLLIALARCDDG